MRTKILSAHILRHWNTALLSLSYRLKLFRYSFLAGILLLASWLSPPIISTAQADEKSGILKIRVKIIQCGAREHINKTCETKPACCTFVEPEPDDKAFEIAKLNSCAMSNSELHDGNGIFANCDAVAE